jgi:hypothetical protein
MAPERPYTREDGERMFGWLERAANDFENHAAELRRMGVTTEDDQQ